MGPLLHLDGSVVYIFLLLTPTYVIQSTANSFTELIAARLMLGIFEAAFGPSVVLYFCVYTFYQSPALSV